MTELPFSAASERNKEPILGVLREALQTRRHVLEIGSGTGQHAAHFARNLPHLQWQCTDRPEYLPGLRARIALEALPNLPTPLQLDVTAQDWPQGPFDSGYSANTLHIMSWPEVAAFFAGMGRALTPDAVLAVYGPFNRDNTFTSASNAAFDADLKRRDPKSGIRDREALQQLAAAQGFGPFVAHALPANNELLVWGRR